MTESNSEGIISFMVAAFDCDGCCPASREFLYQKPRDVFRVIGKMCLQIADFKSKSQALPVLNIVGNDLEITKTDNFDAVLSGQMVTYTITVTNNGPSDASGVALSESSALEAAGGLGLTTAGVTLATGDGGVTIMS